jgi:hypothetical protein
VRRAGAQREEQQTFLASAADSGASARRGQRRAVEEGLARANAELLGADMSSIETQRCLQQALQQLVARR